MNFYDVIAQRRSCRTFQAVDVVQESLERILSACTKAPTAGDLHSFQIVVIRDAERRQRLAEACHDQKQVANAPVVLVFCALPERSRGRYHQRADMYSLQDASIACTVAMLAATAEGLGSCWVGAFVDDEVISAPPSVRPVAVLPIGVPRSPMRPHSGRAPLPPMLVGEHF